MANVVTFLVAKKPPISVLSGEVVSYLQRFTTGYDTRDMIGITIITKIGSGL